MITGHLASESSYKFLTERAIWAAAFSWLRKASQSTPVGDYPLQGFEDAIVKVMAYDTKPIAMCKFESHRRYVDLQYTFSGAEKIAWLPTASLQPVDDYDDSRDLQFYLPESSDTVVHKLPGHFSVFFPEDAHRPQISDGLHDRIYKAVVKIPVNLA
jgi:biofilm protein TabA